MGHNLNLAHSGLINDVTTSDEYGDYSCAMGFCCTTRCYNAPHAYEIGHLPAEEFNDSNLVAGPTTRTLNSMSVTNVDAAITITADWDGGDGHTYWLQFKTADSYDSYMSGSWRNNLQVKRWDKGGYEKTRHLSSLSSGGSYTFGSSDPTKQVTVTVNSIDTSGKTVTVTINRAGACVTDADCDDQNICTSETCEGVGFPGADVFGCLYNALAGCCGNSVCETGEDFNNCAADCLDGPYDLLTPLCSSCYIRNGQMFDIEAKNDVQITSLRFRALTVSGTVNVYTKTGTWSGSETNQGAWTLISTSNGPFTAFEMYDMPFDPINVAQGNKQAFYVTYTTGGDLLYAIISGATHSMVQAEDDNMKIFYSADTDYWTGWTG